MLLGSLVISGARGFCVNSWLNGEAGVQVTLTSSRPTQLSRQESAIQASGMLRGAGTSASTGGHGQGTAMKCLYI